MEFELDKVKYLGLFLGIAGLLALTFLVPEYERVSPGQVSEKIAGKKVSIVGEVKSFFMNGGNAFFEIREAENSFATTSAVAFKVSPEQISCLRNSKEVKVKGTVSVHSGKAGIVVDRITEYGAMND